MKKLEVCIFLVKVCYFTKANTEQVQCQVTLQYVRECHFIIWTRAEIDCILPKTSCQKPIKNYPHSHKNGGTRTWAWAESWSLPRHDPGSFPRMAPCAPSCAGLWVWGQVEFGVWGTIKLCVFVIWQTQIGPCPPCALQGDLGWRAPGSTGQRLLGWARAAPLPQWGEARFS